VLDTNPAFRRDQETRKNFVIVKHHRTSVAGLDKNSIKRKRNQINLRKYEETIVYSLEWYSPSTLLKNFLEQLEYLELEQSVPPTKKNSFL
jgi:hypothetical protein